MVAGELVVGDVHVDHEGELRRALPAGLLLGGVPRHLYIAESGFKLFKLRSKSIYLRFFHSKIQIQLRIFVSKAQESTEL